ncbi:hypothetical protein [Bosea sp. NPDC055594]
MPVVEISGKVTPKRTIPMQPDAEAVNSEAKLVMARIIARHLAANPGAVDRALAGYVAWSAEERSTKPAVYWIEALEKGAAATRRRITQRDKRAAWMRNSTPITLSADLPCLRDVDFRRRIWRDAKRLVARRMRGDLEAFSKGRMSRSEAIHRLGLRDYAELLVALGDEGLPIPMPREVELEAQAAVFEQLWKTT